MELEVSEENTVEEQSNLYKEFDENERLPDYQTSLYLKKDLFLDPKTVTIVKPITNRFGKPSVIVTDGKGVQGELRLKKDQWQEMKDKFGQTPKDLAGREMKVTAIPFIPEKGSNMTEGLSLQIEYI